ncbi:hypothetical protein P3T43_004055 [Paraburkholderia sp. GAS41]|uniref:hypothetical protein n=1 Tax=Paraburkholderia sp. GAS41 TaxID=3035134 RepID=UPI003D1E1449
MMRVLCAVALDALLDLFVDLAQGHAAGTFQLVRIGVGIRIGVICHENGGFQLSVHLILIQMDSSGKHVVTAAL